jgi:hypothetical protein
MNIDSDDNSLGLLQDNLPPDEVRELFSVIDDDDNDFVLPIDEEDDDPKELQFEE